METASWKTELYTIHMKGKPLKDTALQCVQEASTTVLCSSQNFRIMLPGKEENNMLRKS